jgi:probable HAF family extracellular repeat protein
MQMCSFVSSALLILCLLASDAMAQFQGLGDLPGGSFRSFSTGASADGSTVVGFSDDGVSPGQSFIWTSTTGMQPLPNDFDANAVDGSGAAVAGTGPAVSLAGEAVRWTATGQTNLGFLSGGDFSNAFGISEDGSAVVGRAGDGSTTQAFRWTAGGGIEGLGFAPGTFDSSARGVSGDGSVIAGDGGFATGTEAIRWTQSTGMEGLGFLPGATFLFSEALAVSEDGSTIVGRSESGSGTEAFRWTASGGMQGLGDLPGGAFFSHASAVSADGSIVVGAGFNAIGSEAMIWTAAEGMRELDGWLIERGLDLTGWTLEYANGISADGTVIVGTGKNPEGRDEAWIAAVTAPAVPALGVGAHALLLLGLIATAVRLLVKNRN